MKNEIKKTIIPNKLKIFLLRDIIFIESFLDKELLRELEYSYLFYSVFYNVTDEQFSSTVILFIKDNYGDKSLKELLRVSFSEQESSKIRNFYKNRLYKEKSKVLYEEIKIDFLSLVENIQSTGKVENKEASYKLIGKMELISELDDENYYSYLYDLGLTVLKKHIKIETTK